MPDCYALDHRERHILCAQDHLHHDHLKRDTGDALMRLLLALIFTFGVISAAVYAIGEADRRPAPWHISEINR